MSQLTLISPDERSIRPLVESVLLDRVRVLEVAIRRTERSLRTFEDKYGLATDDFLERFGRNEYQHTDDHDDWVGESRMLARLSEKLVRLQRIEIAD